MVKTYLNEHIEGGAYMTTEFEVDLKQTLKAESNYSHWDKQSLNEVMTLIEPYWDSHKLDIEEYIETYMQFYLNGTDFLSWYFEDETPQSVIKYIMAYENNEAVLDSCFNDGTKKLNNGIIACCLI